MMRARSLWRTLLFVPGAMFFAGCYSYRPVETPRVGAAVRVRIPVTTSVGGRSGPSSSVTLEGYVLAVEDTLVLATETRREIGFRGELVQFDTVRIAPDQRTTLELKEFSSGRSLVLGLAIVGGIALLGKTAFGSFGSADEDDGSPTQGAVVVSSSLLSSILSVLAR